ncbi:MAG: hypothetical protein OEL83_04980 [Desulforhopalus sp.]|nr:hypothetical protein [Desulforhopalus sp.]
MKTDCNPRPSKLLRLRDWLTLPESANYLSIVLGEEISEVELLRLVLDGFLKISVNFVNPVVAERRELISEDLKSRMASEWIRKENEYDQVYGEEPSAFFEEVLATIISATPSKILQGIWDLPMIGAERVFIEYQHQMLIGGSIPDRLRHSARSCGTYVEDIDGQVWQIYMYYNNKKSAEDSFRYIPAYYLPEDVDYVFRRQALIDLENYLSQNYAEKEKEPIAHSEKTYLNIIGAFLEITTGTFKGKSFKSETQLRDFIAEKFDDLRGLSPRNTADIFAAAKRAIKDDLD